MSNPLKMIAHANGVYANGVQETSSAELDYLSKLLLIKMGTESGTGDNTADLNIDSTGSSVGTFVDEYANAEILSHDSPAITSTTYTFKQNTATASESGIHHLVTHDGDNSNPGTIRILTDAELNVVIDLAISEISKANSTYAAPGTYYVSSSSPSIGGTWVAQDTFYDELTNHANDDDEKVTYKLWRKTSYDNSPSTIPLLKQINGALKVQTEDELEHLTSRLRNRIIGTSKGKYVFQASAPGAGTWVARGTATNRKPQISGVQYTGTYSDQYAGQYGRAFARQFARQFTRQYSAQYTVQFLRQFQRVYTGQYERQYSRQFARGTAGAQFAATQYARVYSAQYTRETPSTTYSDGQYDRNTPGPQYGVQYTRIYSANYSDGQYDRERPGPQYASQFLREYAGGTYAVSYVRQTPSTPYNAQYQRIYSVNYSVAYTRSNYTRIYGGYGYAIGYAIQYGILYSRTRPGPNYDRSTPGPGYNGPSYQRWYASGPYPENYYLGPYYPFGPIPYARHAFTGIFYRGPAYARATYHAPGTGYQSFHYNPHIGEPVVLTFYRSAGFGRVSYSGPGSGYANIFYREFAGPTYATSYQRTYSAQYGRTYTAQYSVFYTRTYYFRNYYYRARPGPNYAQTYSRSFARNNPGPLYAGTQYTRMVYAIYTATAYSRYRPGPQYEGQFARAYDGQYARQFTRSTPGPQYTIQYAREYDGQYARSFTRVVTAQYARETGGPQYNLTYERQYVGQYTGYYARGDQYTRATPGPIYAGAQYTVQYARTTGGPQYESQYAGAQYTIQYTGQYAGSRLHQYTGDTVTATNDSDTKTLWLRVA